MLNFNLYNPVNVLFGKGESKKAGEAVKTLGKKAMIVTYENPDYFAELLGHVTKSLTDNDVAYVEFYQVKPNPHLSDIKKAIAVCREENVDVVIGIGGGSVMDSAKAIAAGVLYDDDPWKMFVSRHDESVAVPPTKTLPTVMIPTLPATSSETNCVAVATNDETHEKAYIWTPVLYAKIAIMDPELTCTLPMYQTAVGAIDAISHVLEAYFNGDQHSPVQDRLHEALVVAIMDELKAIMKDPQNVDHRANIQWASTLSWNGYLQSGLNASTPMHQMGHVLSALYNTTHGVTLAIFMNAFFRYTCNLNAERSARFAQFGEKVFGIDRTGRTDSDVANEAEDKLVEFIRSVGVPTTLTQEHIPAEDIEKIADNIIAHGCDANGNLPSIPPIGRDGIVKILHMAL